MKSIGKSGEGSKRLAASLVQSLRKSSPSGAKGPGLKSPYASFSMTHLKTRSKWQRCRQKMEATQDDRPADLPRKKSATDIYTEPSNRSASPKSQGLQDDHPALPLNQELTNRLRALGPHYSVRDRYLVFQDVFSKAISASGPWALIFRRIQNGYEEVVTQYLKCDYEKEVERMSAQVQAVNECLDSLLTERESLNTKADTLERENDELRRSVERYSAALRTAEQQLQSLQETARCEHVAAQQLQGELESLRTREKAFLGALKSAKQLNYSVDDLLATLSRHKRTKSTETLKAQRRAEDAPDNLAPHDSQLCKD